MSILKVTHPQVSKNNSLRYAKKGALISSGVFAASTGLSWLTRKDEMIKLVGQYGGAKAYAKNVAAAFGIFAVAGALLNTVFNIACDKIINPNNKTK